MALGKAHHRGIDLIASSSTAVQRIRGEIRYSLVDKALEGEAVDLFACHGGVWKSLGSVITNEEGEFELPLTGDARLPIGLRPLFASVVGITVGLNSLPSLPLRAPNWWCPTLTVR